MTDAWDGRPQNPERDGWHWVAYLDPDMPPNATLWMAGVQRWARVDGPTAERMAEARHYLGPCLTPAEVAAQVAAAVLAEREACAAICGEVARERWAAEKKRPVGEPLFLWLGGPDSECERRIQRQPAPSGADALAAMLAQARREGIEAAAKWHDEQAEQRGETSRLYGQVRTHTQCAAGIRALLPGDAALARDYAAWTEGESDG